MDTGFDPARLIDRLSRAPSALRSIVKCFSEDETRWRPDPRSWSVLEIICHLADEETEDFGGRVLMTLEDPAKPWPSIDPQGWVNDRQYSEQDIEHALERFEHERAKNIERLRAQADPEWSGVHHHPVLGELRAGQMLACWAAHDALHIRQLARRLYQLSERDGGGASTEYAGTW